MTRAAGAGSAGRIIGTAVAIVADGTTAVVGAGTDAATAEPGGAFTTAGVATDGAEAAAVVAVTLDDATDVATGVAGGCVTDAVTAFEFPAEGGGTVVGVTVEPAAADSRSGAALAAGAEAGRVATLGRAAVEVTVGAADGVEAAATDTTGATKGDPSDTGPVVIEIFNLSPASLGAFEFADPALATGVEAAGAVLVTGAVDLAGA